MTGNKSFINAAELADIMEISKGHAYKIIHILNDELNAKGYLTVAGRVPRKYFEERCYLMNGGDKH